MDSIKVQRLQKSNKWTSGHSVAWSRLRVFLLNTEFARGIRHFSKSLVAHFHPTPTKQTRLVPWPLCDIRTVLKTCLFWFHISSLWGFVYPWITLMSVWYLSLLRVEWVILFNKNNNNNNNRKKTQPEDSHLSQAFGLFSGLFGRYSAVG